MVRRRLAPAYLSLAAAISCQSIAGIDDKELDPKYKTTTPKDASTDVVVADSSWDAGPQLNGWSPVPPGRPAGTPTPSGKGARRFFAARNVYFGSVDPTTKKVDADAWKAFGHAIDTEETTTKILQSKSSLVCDKRSSASADLLVDGNEGRDNVGGHLLSYGSTTLNFSFEEDTNRDIESAKKPTYLLMLEDLDSGADDAYVPGAIFVTVKRDLAVEPLPVWNGSDVFYVDANTVIAPDGGTADAGTADAGSPDAADGGDFSLVPRFRFPAGYVRNNVWVSGDFGNTPMTMPLYAFDPVNLVDVETMTLVVELSQQHDTVVRSMMSAVISAQNMDVQFRPIASKMVNCDVLQTGLLMGFLSSTMDLYTSPPAFEQAGSECNAASMAFAFDWVPVVAPPGAKQVAPEPQCP